MTPARRRGRADDGQERGGPLRGHGERARRPLRHGPRRAPAAGPASVPYRELELPDGSRTRVAELLHAGRALLITTDGSGEAERIAAAWSHRVDIVAGTWVPLEGDSLLDAVPDSALVRPDGYIAWSSPGGGDLSDALGRWLGAAQAAVNA
ncbi:hypothetical protein NKH18_02300 [Streptomyces sp. M10(2022)]